MNNKEVAFTGQFKYRKNFDAICLPMAAKERILIMFIRDCQRYEQGADDSGQG